MRPKHFVQGWMQETVEDNQGRLENTAGDQFRDRSFEPVEPGDVVWIVYVDEGDLHLYGRMVVAARRDHGFTNDPDGVILSQREAKDLWSNNDIWEATGYLLAKPGTEKAFHDIKVPLNVVKKLRFQTASGETQVAFDRRQKVSGQAFRRVRLLTPTSAQEFDRLWSKKPARALATG